MMSLGALIFVYYSLWVIVMVGISTSSNNEMDEWILVYMPYHHGYCPQCSKLALIIFSTVTPYKRK